MNVRSWFDLARKVLNLSVQLDAKAAELHAAHRALARAEEKVAFHVAQLDERDKERRKLIAEHEDEKRRLHDAHDRSLVPMVTTPAVALGARDRQNLHRLEGEKEQLRTENEELRRANARLAVLVDECATKHGEGNPS